LRWIFCDREHVLLFSFSSVLHNTHIDLIVSTSQFQFRTQIICSLAIAQDLRASAE